MKYLEMAAEVLEHGIVVATFMLLAIGHFAEEIDQRFGWPPFVVKIVKRRRLAQVVEVLDGLGFDQPARQTIRTAVRGHRLSALARHPDPAARLISLIRPFTTMGLVDVGHTEAVEFSYYVDLMSGSLTADVATECAYILASHVNRKEYGAIVPDYIIGLKQGSPLIGASLSNKLGIPLLLFRGDDQYKKDHSTPRPENLFDGRFVKGKSGVIVDDSTTGGRLVLDCVIAARDAGLDVTQCWVLFEPIGKGARERLRGQNVDLISVLPLTNETIKKLSGTDEAKES